MLIIINSFLLKQGAAEWRDIPAAELGYPQTNEERFRAVNDWGASQFYIVSASILLAYHDKRARCSHYKIMNLHIWDAPNDWAGNRGYLSAFPNFYEANYGNGVVYGTILLNLVATELM